MSAVVIIAEAGVNHNGSEATALRMVDAAAEAGADIIKFQTFSAEKLATKLAVPANYQSKNLPHIASQLKMLEELELPGESFVKIAAYCQEKGIEFLSTAFEAESLTFLQRDIGLKRLKLPSGEITNAPFILDLARTGLDLIVSTGMCSLSDIENALGVIAFGYTAGVEDVPCSEAFKTAYSSESGRRLLAQKVTLLHCTSEYPAPLDEINLRAMSTLESAFGLRVGYSDHSLGMAVPIAAVAMGASIIEKHFTLDKSMQGPDHQASSSPSELAQLVKLIREAEQALGKPVKTPTVSEVSNIVAARKSLVAASDIEAGEKFTSKNLTAKRPAQGISPFEYWRFLGVASKKSYRSGELIDGSE